MVPPPAAEGQAAAQIRWGAVVFALLATCQVALALVHPPWRDEAQAWLVAREPLGRLFGLNVGLGGRIGSAL